ncbi:uncharacterized protein ARMOST_07594 [Armillaria ostoyae]|uniref:Uncharacterized protein n=1 Tax=Armillaria ostoyae TaxID=47428 RepID=A0A284R686_ARMOS|nr:uncharacterized protein ARMOST_07594 [Armillaria ostoyae]
MDANGTHHALTRNDWLSESEISDSQVSTELMKMPYYDTLGFWITSLSVSTGAISVHFHRQQSATMSGRHIFSAVMFGRGKFQPGVLLSLLLNILTSKETRSLTAFFLRT